MLNLGKTAKTIDITAAAKEADALLNERPDLADMVNNLSPSAFA